MKKLFILLIIFNINLSVFPEENSSLISDFVNNKTQTENTENSSLISDFVNNKSQTENTENTKNSSLISDFVNNSESSEEIKSNLKESDLNNKHEKLNKKVGEQIQNYTTNCINSIPEENSVHIGKSVLSLSSNDSERKIEKVMNDELKQTCNSWYESMKCSIVKPYNSEFFNNFDRTDKLFRFVYLSYIFPSGCLIEEFSKKVFKDCLSGNDSTVVSEENNKLNKYYSCSSNLENKLKKTNFQSSYTDVDPKMGTN